MSHHNQGMSRERAEQLLKILMKAVRNLDKRWLKNKNCSWLEVRAFFEAEINRLSRSGINLEGNKEKK